MSENDRKNAAGLGSCILKYLRIKVYFFNFENNILTAKKHCENTHLSFVTILSKKEL